MVIEKLHLINFRRYEDITLTFDSRFNVLIGDNAAGKTTIIDAVNAALSNYFAGIFGSSSEHIRNIQKEDIRRQFWHDRPELQYPLEVKAMGYLNGIYFQSIRIKDKNRGKNLGNMKKEADKMERAASRGETILLPVVAYYGNGRNSLERRESRVKKEYSRLEGGYYNSSSPTSNIKYFKDWYKGKQATIIQTKASSHELELIKQAVLKCIPNAQDIYYNFEKGIDDIEIVTKDNERMPFRMLSDGYRAMLALVADIAFRCASLNPQLGLNALLETNGVVLIDELDLYLHPIWQSKVVKDLTDTFPKIQFIVTTHSPLIVASAQAGQVIQLTDDIKGIFSPKENSYAAWQLSDILTGLMCIGSLPDSEALRTVTTRLQDAFEKNKLDDYDDAYRELVSIVSPNDALISVYQIQRARLMLKL